MTTIEIPTYNINESVTNYMKKVEKYKNYILKEKYIIILNFLNEWTEGNYKSLTDFKNINEYILLKDKKHNNKIVKKYSEIFEKKLNVDLSVDAETDSDDITDKYIILILQKVLNYLDYYLSKTLFDNKIFYSIKKK
jgi:hypothetical protein